MGHKDALPPALSDDSDVLAMSAVKNFLPSASALGRVTASIDSSRDGTELRMVMVDPLWHRISRCIVFNPIH